ncbi:hypothetical protein DAI22_03g095300 [Oryza sativa Japonica Group]|jgi:hypothetical protein|uniref:Uncharacterized protein n=4 Tax=Oryza TaxID=4527 RepID=Q10PR2_ORYSJ|nr:hypothetical protein LOC_Os03g12380 [Oryza sativa Japonica Group]KAF2938102.1 hypothetical protein DAI22_03g095300 [Oryza sativa Japonica Group]
MVGTRRTSRDLHFMCDKLRIEARAAIQNMDVCSGYAALQRHRQAFVRGKKMTQNMVKDTEPRAITKKCASGESNPVSTVGGYYDTTTPDALLWCWKLVPL